MRAGGGEHDGRCEPAQVRAGAGGQEREGNEHPEDGGQADAAYEALANSGGVTSVRYRRSHRRVPVGTLHAVGDEWAHGERSVT
jgi:hypothetical protein